MDIFTGIIGFFAGFALCWFTKDKILAAIDAQGSAGASKRAIRSAVKGRAATADADLTELVRDGTVDLSSGVYRRRVPGPVPGRVPGRVP